MDHWKELAIAILSVLLQSSSTINTCLFDVPLMGSYCRLLVRMDLTESRLDVCLGVDDDRSASTRHDDLVHHHADSLNGLQWKCERG